MVKETNLETGYGNKIYYQDEYLKQYKNDLLEFLDGIDYMRTLGFAKSVMMSEEIQANNNIEGINDDLTEIDDAINSSKPRISNLYKGYKYILTHENINKESLKNLYAIISKDLLNEHDRTNMGEYYRGKPVYILRGSRLDVDPYLGMDADKIDYHMNNLFEYINTDENIDEIDNFIKSQVMHFYFVFIHPYFDMNGRTSRTVSMWYLLNHNAYPYIILNRAITFAKREYENKIIAGRCKGDITLFLRYMLVQVQKELEKEYVINSINRNLSFSLSKEESQMIEYFISNNNNTIKDLVVTYNRYNAKKKLNDLVLERIDPLIDRDVFISLGDTKGYINSDRHNSHLALNGDLIDIDRGKVKYLNLNNFINKKQ